MFNLALHRPLVGDVLACPDYPHGLSIVVEHCFGALADKADLAIGPDDAVLKLCAAMGKRVGDRFPETLPVLRMHELQQRLEGAFSIRSRDAVDGEYLLGHEFDPLAR